MKCSASLNAYISIDHWQRKITCNNYFMKSRKSNGVLSDWANLDASEKLLLKDCGIYWKAAPVKNDTLVGYSVHKNIKGNLGKYKGISKRLTYLIINKDKFAMLKIIQKFMHPPYNDDDELCCENIERILSDEKTTNIIVIIKKVITNWLVRTPNEPTDWAIGVQT